jgi:hypothetical protein
MTYFSYGNQSFLNANDSGFPGTANTMSRFAPTMMNLTGLGNKRGDVRFASNERMKMFSHTLVWGDGGKEILGEIFQEWKVIMDMKS